MEVFTKKNSEYSKVEKVFTAVFAFITFGIVGGLVRFFGDPIILDGSGGLLNRFLPHILGFGCLAAILGYFFPKPLNIVMCFLPTPGVGS